MRTNMWWIGPLVLSLLRFLVFEAQAEREKTVHGSMVCQGSSVSRILFAFGFVGFVVLGFWGLHGNEALWLVVMSWLFAIGNLVVWPAALVMNSAGLRERRWWRSPKAIAWTDVTAAERRKDGYVLVYGKDGTTITFTNLHVNRFGFEREVMARAKLKKIDAYGDPVTLRH